MQAALQAMGREREAESKKLALLEGELAKRLGKARAEL
jgi:hypothetical protein